MPDDSSAGLSIVSEREEPSFVWEIELDEPTRALLAAAGRAVATEDDYIRIALNHAITSIANERWTPDLPEDPS